MQLEAFETHIGEDADEGAPRRLLAAVVILAMRDLTQYPPTHINHSSSVRFFWGDWSHVSDKYLGLLGLEPRRFKRTLQEHLTAGTLAV